MSDHDDSQPVPLRVIPQPRATSTGASDPDDAVTRLGDALAAIDAKLQTDEGAGGLIDLLHTAETIVDATSSAQLDGTRRSIHELIDRLLTLNAQVRNVARLKRLLS